MFTMFSKKIVTVSVASVLVSLSAGAMQQASQGYEQSAQQCRKGPSLVLCERPGTSIECEMTFDKTKYELIGGTTVDMEKTTKHTCQIKQPLSDDYDYAEEYPVGKCAPEIEQCGKLRGKGTQCGATETQVLKKSEKVDYEGVKTSVVEVTRLQTAQLRFHGGDGVIVENKCGPMSTDEFFSHWKNRDAIEGFDLFALRNQIDAAIASKAIAELDKRGGSVSFQGAQQAAPVSKPFVGKGKGPLGTK